MGGTRQTVSPSTLRRSRLGASTAARGHPGSSPPDEVRYRIYLVLHGCSPHCHGHKTCPLGDSGPYRRMLTRMTILRKSNRSPEVTEVPMGDPPEQLQPSEVG